MLLIMDTPLNSVLLSNYDFAQTIDFIVLFLQVPGQLANCFVPLYHFLLETFVLGFDHILQTFDAVFELILGLPVKWCS